MEIHPTPADELPERLRVGETSMFPEPEQGVSDAVRREQKQYTHAPIQIEKAQELASDGLNHPLGQAVKKQHKGIHQELASLKEKVLKFNRNRERFLSVD